jgi:Protein of unknown function, DUF481
VTTGPKCCAALGVLSLVLFTTRSARAQVDVEPLRKELKDKHGLGGHLSGSLSAYRGNTNGIVFGAGGLVGAHSAPHFAYIAASGNYAEYESTATVSNSFAHARYNYELTRWLAGELFAQVEADRFRRISRRDLLGIGPRFALFQSDPFDLYYGDGYMLEHTERSDGSTVLAHRFSNYVALAYRPEDRIVLSTTLYYQPRFDDFGDFRLLGIGGAEFEITKVLKSRIGVVVRHESRVPSDVKRTDFELDNSLALKF